MCVIDINSVVEEFKKRHTKRSILEQALKNEEKPFGYVIDWLKDNGIPKTQGWDYAEEILEHFQIDNEADIEKQLWY